MARVMPLSQHHTITSGYVTNHIVLPKHRGIDLAEEVLRFKYNCSRSGIAITVVNNCTSGGNKDCGGLW